MSEDLFDNPSRARHALFVAIIAWVPLAVLAAAQGLAIGPTPRESLLKDVATYARYLLALPLLVLAERACHKRLSDVMRHFLDAGIIADSNRSVFLMHIESARRALGSRNAKIVIVLVAYAAAFLVGRTWYLNGTSTWMAPATSAGHALSLAGWWRLLVSQPLFLVMLLGWLWRLLVWGWLLWRVSRMELQLVASHPDLAGGLNFLSNSLQVFPILALAFGCAMGGNIADEVLYDGKRIAEFSIPIVALVLIVLVLFVGPLLSFSAPLFHLKASGTLRYGSLATSMGKRFEQKWIEPAQEVDHKALEAPDFSATTDLYALAANVRELRVLPVNLMSVALLVLSALLPLVPVLLIAVPVKQVLGYVGKLVF